MPKKRMPTIGMDTSLLFYDQDFSKTRTVRNESQSTRWNSLEALAIIRNRVVTRLTYSFDPLTCKEAASLAKSRLRRKDAVIDILDEWE